MVIQFKTMKTSTHYEVLASILAVCGAIALVFVYYPLLNPVQFRLTPGPEIEPSVRYFFGTPAALLILAAAWHFNCKAIAGKRGQ
ncbi:MAG: hypothetical protein ACR2FY_00410 [Pirellulaceae bacterium]